ncbi:MAG: hypothetical protein AAF658_18145, partial [Myxococcota bacterium]
IAYQIIAPPRGISRPIDQHRFLSGQSDRATEVLNSGMFIYMSQIAVDRGARRRAKELGEGSIAAEFQARVLENYKSGLALVCHVAVFTDRDLEGWSDAHRFEPESNNVTSHVYHQRAGYQTVGYVSDSKDARFNTGMKRPHAGDGITGVMLIDYRDGSQTRAYIDPVQQVVDEATSASRGGSVHAPWNSVDPELYRSFYEGRAPAVPELISTREGLRSELDRMGVGAPWLGYQLFLGFRAALRPKLSGALSAGSSLALDSARTAAGSELYQLVSNPSFIAPLDAGEVKTALPLDYWREMPLNARFGNPYLLDKNGNPPVFEGWFRVVHRGDNVHEVVQDSTGRFRRGDLVSYQGPVDGIRNGAAYMHKMTFATSSDDCWNVREGFELVERAGVPRSMAKRRR